MNYILLFLLCIISNTFYASLSQVPVYPSSIKVSFIAPSKLVFKDNNKRRSRRKKKNEKVISNTIPFKVNKFIRVINSISDIPDSYSLALVFYDSNNNIININSVTNSQKPSPTYIFYMDRKSNRKFQGMRDIYHIPRDAFSYNISILDTNINIILSTEHEYYDDKVFLIDNFVNIHKNNNLMLQFEITGTFKDFLTRISFFKFQ